MRYNGGRVGRCAIPLHNGIQEEKVNAMLLNIVFMVLGLAGLYAGGTFLVNGSSRVALHLRISPLVVGLTIVAVGTSAPELIVSVLAALRGSPGLALGNVIGSNIANIGLILGLTGIVQAVRVQRTLVRREIPILIFVSLFAIVLILDGQVSRVDGLLLLLGFVAFNGLFYFLSRTNGNGSATIPKVEAPPEEMKNARFQSLPWQFVRIVLGSVLLVIGAQLMIEGAQSVARALGVSDLVIGVTMVAFSTSLPELAASLTAVAKDEMDIAVGNVIGSNIVNLLLVLGATSAVASIDVGQTDLSVVEYLVMLGFTLLLLPFARDRALSRIESAMFLGAYVAFVLYSFSTT